MRDALTRRGSWKGFRRAARGSRREGPAPIATRAFVAVLALAALGAEARADDEPVPRIAKTLPTAQELQRAAQAAEGRIEEVKASARAAREAVAEGRTTVEKAVNRGLLVSWAAVPEAALEFTFGVFVGVRALHARDPAALEDMGDACRGLAQFLAVDPAPTEVARAAGAYGRLAHAWATEVRFPGDGFDGKRVRAAAETLREVETPRADADVWKAFVRDMVSAGVHRWSAETSAWAIEEASRLRQEEPADPAWQHLDAHRQLADALQLAAYEEKGAAAALGKILAATAPDAGLPSNDVLLVALYNRAVTAARRLRVNVPAPYRTRRVTTRSGRLAFDLPIGTGWVGQPAGADPDQDDVHLVRDHGISERAVLRVYHYRTDADYRDADGKVIGGDNVGGRAKAEFEADRASLRSVKKASGTAGKLSKAIPDVKGYETRGQDDVFQEVWNREWFFKAPHAKQHVLNVSMRRRGIVLSPDPEIDFILESMHDPTSK